MNGISKKPCLQNRLGISVHLKICISCSLMFLAQNSEGDTHFLTDSRLSNSNESCECSQIQVLQTTDLIWLEFVNELALDTFIGSRTANSIANFTNNSGVYNVSSNSAFYLVPACKVEITGSRRDFGDCEIINKFTRQNSDFCRLSEICQSNLGKKKLRVAGVLSEEYAYDTTIVKKSDGSYAFEDSFSVELLKCLELTLNFTTIPVVTLFWGHLLPNNSWTGMIALLLANQADLGISSIADRPFRRAVVDFNIPTNEIRLAAFFKKPSTISSELTALLKPFQTEFWLALILLGIGTSLTAFIINRVLHKSGKSDLFRTGADKARTVIEFLSEVSQVPGQKDEDDSSLSKESRWSGMDCVTWSISTICLQGFYRVPSEISPRIGMIVGSLSGFVVYSAYAGTLVSFLSVVTEPIQNLGQLVSTDFTFVVVNEPLPLNFLSDSPISKNVMVYQRRNTEKSYSTMTQAYSKIIQGSFVFVTDHIGAYESLSNDFSVHEACLIREIGIENAEQKQGTLVRKDSPYKRVIDYQILRMVEYGLVRRWNSKYLKTKPACDNQSKYEGVELGSILIAYAILGCGMVFGTFGLLIETFIIAKVFYKKRKLPISVW